jgi:hypothetical protein
MYAIQALRSPKHEQPGLQAIIELHRDFIGAAQMNPNSWLLHRDQVAAIPLWLSHLPLSTLCLSIPISIYVPPTLLSYPPMYE